MNKIIIIQLLLLYTLRVNSQQIKWVYEIKGKNNLPISKNILTPPVIDTKGNSFFLIQCKDTLLINNQPIINSKKSCIVLMSLDSNGIYRWSLAMNAGTDLAVKDMIATSDGSVILIGNYNGDMLLSNGTKVDSIWYTNGFLFKVNTSGNLVWSKSHKYAHNGLDAKLASDDNGNIYINLVTSILGAMVNDTALQHKKGVSVAKFSKDGNLIKVNSNISNASVGNIAVSKDGNHLYIFNVLDSKSNIQYDSLSVVDTTLQTVEKDFYVAGADKDLNFVFLKRFPAKATYAIDHLYNKSMCVDAKGNFYFSYIFIGKLSLAGKDFNSLQHFPIWLKIDTLGAIKWVQSSTDSNGYYGTSYNMGIGSNGRVYTCFNASGTYEIGTLNVSQRAFLNMYFDDSANIIAAREFWGNGFPTLSGSVVSDGDNTFVLQIGDSVLYNQQYYGNGSNKIVFLKIANPNFSFKIDKKQFIDNISVYPNPTNGIVTIKHDLAKRQSFSIYNNLGEIIYQSTLLPNSGEQLIDIGFLPDGLYLLRVGDTTIKIVKQ